MKISGCITVLKQEFLKRPSINNNVELVWATESTKNQSILFIDIAYKMKFSILLTVNI